MLAMGQFRDEGRVLLFFNAVYHMMYKCIISIVL